MSQDNPLKDIVGLSDLHCGDQLAICPESFELDYPSTRPVRDWLRHAFWDATVNHVPKWTGNRPFLLILNGDIVQGNWSRFGQLLTKDVPKQCLMAVTLLAPLIQKAAKVIVVEGTEVHSGDSEDMIGRVLDEKFPGKVVKSPDDRFVHSSARFKMNGQIHTVRHHTSIAVRTYTEASGRGIHLADEQLRRVRAGHERTDVLWTAHNHCYTCVETLSGMAITTPSWQFGGRHVRKVTPEDTSTVGLVVASYANRDYGESPDVRAYKKSFPELNITSFDAATRTEQDGPARRPAKRRR